MEALQLAQMLADLNDLQASQDQSASKALVTANQNLDQKNQLQPPPLHHRRSATADGRPVSTPGRVSDKYGLRMLSPPMTRTNSGTPVSGAGTPRDHHSDTDVDRAHTLLSLCEIRAKLKEQDNSSLNKAREKINALSAKQAQAATRNRPVAQREQSEPPRISFPRRS
ncbi:hypothetical protein GGR56DRAFT_670675 [Xylariaceae sp. FL0804]|nr:hypothetical protein GGR56DRAFT_670675 [Xylariaceae sp. FL0804]